MALPSHARKKHAQPPSRDAVLAFVELADTGDHWYWTGDIVYDGLDPWPVLHTEHGTWHVMRLLLPPSQGPHHVNACGLRTCVCPGHWKLVRTNAEAIVTDFDGAGWRSIT